MLALVVYNFLLALLSPLLTLFLLWRLWRGKEDAARLAVPIGSAGLAIERVSYLASGRAVEFTRSLYRGDAYDFVAELTIGES